MTPDDVTNEMLLHAGCVNRNALRPKKNIYAERDRLDALAQARRTFCQHMPKADSVTDKFKLEVAALYEATHDGSSLPEDFWAMTHGCDPSTRVSLCLWDDMARDAARDKEHTRALGSKRTRRRLSRTTLATPLWVDFKAIAGLIIARDAKTRATGIEHHIDHIVPLAGELVCGLHWHGNMRIIPATDNLVKSRKFRVGVDGE